MAAEAVSVTALYGALCLVLLAPLSTHPASAILDAAAQGGAGGLVQCDIHFVFWVLAWDCHALATDPLRLFHANIFHPAPRALAGSEHMLGHLPLYAPVYALTGNAVLAHQTNLILSIVLCGSAAYALLRSFALSAPAAFFGGFVYAFCPLRILGIGHVQHVAGQYLPLALLFLRRALLEGRWRFGMAFGAFLLWQSLCSYYLAYVAWVSAAAFGIAVVLSAVGSGRRPIVRPAIVAAIAAASVMGLSSLPYLRARAAGTIPQEIDAAWLRAAGAERASYLTRPRGHGMGPSLYLGVLPVALAALGLTRFRSAPPELPRPWKAGMVAAGVAGYLLSLGPHTSIAGFTVPLPYALFAKVVPGFSTLRAPFRFAFALVLAVAALSAAGLEKLLAWRGRRMWRASVLVAVLVLCTVWDDRLLALPPKVARVAPETLPLSRLLAALPRAPLLEVPARGAEDAPGDLLRESRYMVASTAHWLPLLNGYSGYAPPSYRPIMLLASMLPDPRALELLGRMTGLRYVLVHEDELGPRMRERLAAPEGLDLIGAEGRDRLYRVEAEVAPDLEPALLDAVSRAISILGTPLRPLPESGRNAEVRIEAPASARAGAAMKIEVTVRNEGDRTWPSLAPRGEHVVGLAYRWPGTDLGLMAVATPLPYDLGARESARFPVVVRTPAAAGDRQLEAAVIQDGSSFNSPGTATILLRDAS